MMKTTLIILAILLVMGAIVLAGLFGLLTLMFRNDSNDYDL